MSILRGEKTFLTQQKLSHEISKPFYWSNIEENVINRGHILLNLEVVVVECRLLFDHWSLFLWMTLDDESDTLLVSLETGMSDALLSGEGAVIGAFGMSDDALLSVAGAVICSFSVCWNLDIISSISVI